MNKNENCEKLNLKNYLVMGLKFFALFIGLLAIGTIARTLWMTGGASWFDISLKGYWEAASTLLLAAVCGYAMGFTGSGFKCKVK